MSQIQYPYLISNVPILKYQRCSLSWNYCSNLLIWHEHISARSQCCHGVMPHSVVLVTLICLTGWDVCDITVILSWPHMLTGNTSLNTCLCPRLQHRYIIYKHGAHFRFNLFSQSKKEPWCAIAHVIICRMNLLVGPGMVFNMSIMRHCLLVLVLQEGLKLWPNV